MAGLICRLQQGMIVTACIAVCSMFSGSAYAGFIISYDGNSIAAGGTGTLDVQISSDAADSMPDFLDSFSAHFRITPVGGAVPNGLQFANLQVDSQLGDPSYVLHDDSLGETFGGPLGLVSNFINSNDTYIGGDGTVTGTGIPLSITSGTSLLFQLNLDATLANLGDQFMVSLINDGSTEFLGPGFATISLNASSFDANTATAVPEPSSAVMFLVAALGIGVFRRRLVA